MDDNWWPNISLADEKTFWELLQPGQTLEITAGPKQINLVLPKQIEDRAHELQGKHGIDG